MEMLNCLYAFETLPILEPDDVLYWYSRAKGLDHVPSNILSRFFRQVARDWVIVKFKLDPDDKVNDPRINPIGPVIIKDLDIIC